MPKFLRGGRGGGSGGYLWWDYDSSFRLTPQTCVPLCSVESDANQTGGRWNSYFISWGSLVRCIIKLSPVERYVNNQSRVEHNMSRFFLFLFSSFFSYFPGKWLSRNGNEGVTAWPGPWIYTYFFSYLLFFSNIFTKDSVRIKGLYNRFSYVVHTWFICFATSFSNNNIIVIVVVLVIIIIIIIMDKLLAKAGCLLRRIHCI